MTTLRLALAQINTTVGDIAGNAAKVLMWIEKAQAQNVDIILFPELTITGYPPEDLLFKTDFIAANREALEGLVAHTAGITAVVGFVEQADDLYNAAAVLHDGRLAGIYRKRFLPTYTVFDEDRYFAPGESSILFNLPLQYPSAADGEPWRACLGVNICEDIWYPDGPPEAQATAGAEILLNISASPYQAGKIGAREQMLKTRAMDNVAVVAFCNLVGGQDELVFDGSSLILDERGQVLARGKSFAEDFLLVDINVNTIFRQRLRDPRRRKQHLTPATTTKFERVPLAVHPPTLRAPLTETFKAAPLSRLEEIYQALIVGTRDYVYKNGFGQVVIGLSGGIDSSLVAAIAADAIGAENVVGVSMPSRYSSEHSRDDAAELAANLGIQYQLVPIEAAYQAYLEMLAPSFGDLPMNVAEENLQARIRGNILMGLSNKFGWLLLTTGNKSEMAVGYATLYGDMAGGFAVIKDVWKELVYELCRYRNEQGGVVIPENVITKPPSAELRPDQKDSDSLPPYEILDGILEAYVEKEYSVAEMVAAGYEADTVYEVIRLVNRSEHKRRQAPLGPKVTTRAFGKDRRLPITNWYMP
ncbi:MAG TPA: NAD+ synthase [Anaerolineae bacterium]|nr:NAD+ synthase [Anaerolineae bacterium]